MSNKEVAIALLSEFKEKHTFYGKDHERDMNDTFDLAIKALELVDNSDKSDDDLISREALKRALEITQYNDIADLIRTERLIDNAPTVCNDNYAMGYQDGVKKVLSERPTGEWIVDGHHYKCSICGKTLAIIPSESDDDLIGCPYCLADMRGGRE